MSETIPSDLGYTEEHEWVRRLEGGVCRIGITHYAQDELGEVVYVELPEVGQTVEAEDELGSIESVKAVAELYSPVTGEVTAVNGQLEETPEKVNEDPYGEGWLVEVRPSEEAGLDALLNAEAYALITSGN